MPQHQHHLAARRPAGAGEQQLVGRHQVDVRGGAATAGGKMCSTSASLQARRPAGASEQQLVGQHYVDAVGARGSGSG